jgi:hypothetical protein
MLASEKRIQDNNFTAYRNFHVRNFLYASIFLGGKMKKTTIYIALMIALTQFTSCEFINGLIYETKKADTRVDHMTSNFTITDDIIYINFLSDTQTNSTFAIDTSKEDIISRIYFCDGDKEYSADQVKAYNNRLWMLGDSHTSKVLIFNPETGETENVINYKEYNAQKMNFLPSMGLLALMHGNGYDKGFSVTLIDIASQSYKGMAYVPDQVAPNILDLDGVLYGSGNDMALDSTKMGFGTYTLRGDVFEFNMEFALSPATDANNCYIVESNKFLVLAGDEGKTYVVCDNKIGIKIKYPDGSESSMYIDDEPYDPAIGNYKEVRNIYYSEEYDRIYVEQWAKYLYSYMEKDAEGKWQWNTTNVLPFVYKFSRASKINKDALVETYKDEDNTIFYARFYDIKDFTFLKEIQWNLSTDEKTIVLPE